MTKLLEEAFAKASRLPRWEQDALAAMILEEIASNQQWKNALANTKDEMAQLFDESITRQPARTGA
jgi:hypothetical protein